LQPKFKCKVQELEIVYEDNYCFVVNKPNNLIVHHSHYARNVNEESLVELLVKKGYVQPIPVHRLDRKTSGLILFVKNSEFVLPFQSLFETNQIGKVYVALVRGYIDSLLKVNTPIKNERGNYKEALSFIKSVQKFEKDFSIPPYPKARYSVVIMQPITGRTHQLRVHSNKISHPIIGDHRYGNRHHNRYFEVELSLPNLFLHAYKLSFFHPYLDKRIVLKGSFPGFWSVIYDKNHSFNS